MKYEQYTSLIEKLEDYAKENPKGYEWRVAALGALGYGYFLGLFFLFIILPILLVGLVIAVPQLLWILLKFGIKIVLFLIVALFGFLKVFWDVLGAFWTKIPAPEGTEIFRADAPKLFEKVEQICEFLKSPRPNHILLIEDFNAAVITVPRFGLFGKKVYLLIGLPLMQAITPEQFEAVLAHEIGHISGKHSRFSTWAYRLKETWGRFVASQEAEGNNLSFLYASFLNWYIPYFNAYSFVLCRRQEREADEFAVQYVGAKPLGEALINLEIKTRHLSQKFWKDVLDEAANDKTPPKELFTRMAMAFRETDKIQDLKNLSKAVAINTDYNDSHPSLAERLKTMGYWQNTDLPSLPSEAIETASCRYLGNLEEKYAVLFNQLWQERVKEEWQNRHDFLLDLQKRLDELDEKSKNEELSSDELYEKASLVAEKFGEKKSLPILLDIIEKFPEYANAQYAVGIILLNDDDERGINYIEKAIQIDKTLKMSGCEMIYYFLRSKGRDEEAKKYVLEIEAEEEIVNLANQERSGISPNDNFIEHDFSIETIEKICSKIQYYDEIQTAYLVKKDVQHYSEVPLYVLFFDTKKKGWLSDNTILNTEELLKVMVERLSEFGVHYFVVLENNLVSLKPKLEQINNAKIYQR